jgi:hypothetical protein
MAHFAELEANNIIINVVVVHNSVLHDEELGEVEQKGIDFLNENIRASTWKQTSFNNSIRGNFAAIGYTYNQELDAFIPPPRFASWTTLNTETFQYEPAVGMPEYVLGYRYRWDDDAQEWITIEGFTPGGPISGPN